MSDPKQRLTRFAQIYSAEQRQASKAAPTFHRDLPLAGELASAHLLQEDDATALGDLQCLYSITTVEELVAIARIDERDDLGLLDGLKLRSELVQSLVRAFQDSDLVHEELSDWERYESLEYTLGCEIDLETPPPPEDESLAAGALGGPSPGPPPAAAPAPPPLPASAHWINSHMPPSKALAEAGAFTAPHVLQLPPRSVDTIKRALLQERLVGIGIPVYKSWFESPVVRKYGNITVPIPGEVAEPVGHAVVLAGFQDDPEFAGGGYFIVRNSWDHYWAAESVLGSGYGTIPYRYISNFNWDAWCVTP